MKELRNLWLVVNAASGSNDEDSHVELRRSFEEAGLAVFRVTRFPDQDLPTPAQLDEAGSTCVAVYTGDGTLNALITSLYGWDGAVLVLPGGTMNLLFHRLHGDRSVEEVLGAVMAGKVACRRPALIRCEKGDGLAGLMAGPGTAWNDVREALRHGNIAEMASSAAAAIEESVGAPKIVCREPSLGRAEGYPLLEMTPHEDGFAIDAYHSDTAEEYLAQGLALLKRDFREGPSDNLGRVKRLTIASVAGGNIGLLLDGEPAEAGPVVEFELAACEVDLLATQIDD